MSAVSLIPRQVSPEDIDLTMKNGMTIAGKLWGHRSKPLVIALHGWLDNANSFDAIAPLMPAFQILALDLPGHGLSSHRPADCFYYPWEDVMVVKEVMDILEKNKNSQQTSYGLVGHSAGGGVATLVASVYPSKVNKLALIDSAGLAFTTDIGDAPKYFASSVRRTNLADSLKMDGFSAENSATFSSVEQAIAERTKGFSGVLSEDVAATLTQRALKKVVGGYRWRTDPRLVFQPPVQLSESQAQAFIQEIKSDALVLLGDTGLFAKGEGDHRLACFQKVTTKVFAGGHHLHLEQAKERIAEELNQFL